MWNVRKCINLCWNKLNRTRSEVWIYHFVRFDSLDVCDFVKSICTTMPSTLPSTLQIILNYIFRYFLFCSKLANGPTVWFEKFFRGSEFRVSRSFSVHFPHCFSPICFRKHMLLALLDGWRFVAGALWQIRDANYYYWMLHNCTAHIPICYHSIDAENVHRNKTEKNANSDGKESANVEWK